MKLLPQERLGRAFSRPVSRTEEHRARHSRHPVSRHNPGENSMIPDTDYQKRDFYCSEQYTGRIYSQEKNYQRRTMEDKQNRCNTIIYKSQTERLEIT